jgi:hypothetical protein
MHEKTPILHPPQVRARHSEVEGVNPLKGLIRMRGEWRDVYKDERGNVVHDTGWNPNQVQNTNAVLLASVCKNRVGYTGFLYFAFGTGLPAWDTAAPTQPFTQTGLTTEVFRKSVPPASITFRNAITGANIEPTPSNVIQVDVTLALGEANGNALREFGVFSGNATGVSGSGLTTNWIVHSRIDKNASISIERAVRFTFEVQ